MVQENLIIEESNFKAFLYKSLKETINQNYLDVSEETEMHVLETLSRFFDKPQQASGEIPLTVILERAMHQQDQFEKLEQFVELGQRSFFVASFQLGRVGKNFVDLGYFIGLGELAYLQAYNLTRGSCSSIYEEVGMKFPKLAWIASVVLGTDKVNTYQGFLKMYESYKETHGEVDIERLIREKMH